MEEEQGTKETFWHNKRIGLNCPLLTQLKKSVIPVEDDNTLIKRYQDGDLNASYLLLIKHYKFILKRILEITKGHWFSEDILQAGAVGLFEAAKRFDPNKGFKFLTYAGSWINKYIYIEVRNELLPMGGISIGRDMKELLFNYIKLVAQGYTDKEILSSLNISEKKLTELKVMNVSASNIQSLDERIKPTEEGEKGEDYYNFIANDSPSVEDEVIHKELKEFISNIINELHKTEPLAAIILNMKLGLNGEDIISKKEICAKLKIKKTTYAYQERIGNKFLRTELIKNGWYNGKEKTDN